MPTFDSKQIVDKIIANDGHYDGDPQALQVSSYINQGGKLAWHVSYTQRELDSFNQSPYVRDIKILWRRS